MNFQLASVIIISGMFGTLGLVVLLTNHKKITNLLFFFMAICSIAWAATLYLSNLHTGYELLMNRLIYVSSATLAYAVLLLSFHFPHENKNMSWKKYLLISIPTFLLDIGVLFSPYFVESFVFTDWGTDINLGNLYFTYPIYFFLYFTLAIIVLIRRYRKISDANEKKGILLFIVGLLVSMILGYLTNSLSYYILGNYYFSQFGYYSLIFIIAAVSYSIIKHSLFDIKVIVTETATIIVLAALGVQILFSDSNLQRIVNILIFGIVTYGGVILIRSVKQEIKRREVIEKLAKQLNIANEHLKEMDKIKDDFLSMASHELNTPIAAIEGYLSMILVEKMAGKLPDKAEKYLQSVFTSSQRLAHLVKDLLNVSRIEGNRIHIIYDQKPIEDVVKQCMMEIDPKIKEAHHTLIFHEPKRPIPPTWFDLTRITEVLINMLGNSCKYTDPGGKIEINVVNDDQKIIVSVTDNGKGIPKERNKAVFEKFSQVDVLKDEVKGTGLGMYISKRFIELHRGKMWFHSDGAGKGTTFYFSLPILKSKPFDSHEGEGAILH